MRESGGCSALSPKSFGSPGRRVRACRPGGYKSSVEACWPPLTPEHGFPSLILPARSAPSRPAPCAGRVCFSVHPPLSGPGGAKKQGVPETGNAHRGPRKAAHILPPVALPTSGQRVGALPAPSQPAARAPLVCSIMAHRAQNVKHLYPQAENRLSPGPRRDRIEKTPGPRSGKEGKTP